MISRGSYLKKTKKSLLPGTVYRKGLERMDDVYLQPQAAFYTRLDSVRETVDPDLEQEMNEERGQPSRRQSSHDISRGST